MSCITFPREFELVNHTHSEDTERYENIGDETDKYVYIRQASDELLHFIVLSITLHHTGDNEAWEYDGGDVEIYENVKTIKQFNPFDMNKNIVKDSRTVVHYNWTLTEKSSKKTITHVSGMTKIAIESLTKQPVSKEVNMDIKNILASIHFLYQDYR